MSSASLTELLHVTLSQLKITKICSFVSFKVELKIEVRTFLAPTGYLGNQIYVRL